MIKYYSVISYGLVIYWLKTSQVTRYEFIARMRNYNMSGPLATKFVVLRPED